MAADAKAGGGAPRRAAAGFLILVALGAGGAAAIYAAHRSSADPAPAQADPLLARALSARKAGDTTQAVALWEQAAALDDPSGLFHLGRAYLRGIGLRQDPARARALLMRSAELGGPLRGSAAYELGKIYARSTGADCDRLATEWFHKAADWGFAKAHLQLGRRYKRGVGAAQDAPRAYRHFAMAAEAGHESAAIELAAALLSGREGIPRNTARADALMRETIARLRLKAVEGRSTAIKLLGRIYRHGVGVPIDLSIAAHWYRRAAEGGDRGGMRDLAMTLLIDPASPQDAAEAINWLRRSADLRDGPAMTALGRLHVNGRHGLDPADARAWFEAGVAVGHPGAMEELARLTAATAQTAPERAAARELARRGAALGHAGARRLFEELEAKAPQS